MERARVTLHISPRASSQQVMRRQDGSFALKLTAPPVEGSANTAAVEFLADCLDIRRSRVALVSGQKSREKTFEIAGLSEREITNRLAKLAD
jgi:uncharacterized protein